MIRTLTLGLLLLAPLATQAQDPATALSSFMESFRSNGTQPFPTSVAENMAGQEAQLLTIIRPYLSDSLSQVRYRAYSTLNRLGQASENPSFRQQVVMALLEGSKDPAVASGTSSMLAQYPKEAFNPAALDTVVAIVQREQGSYSNMIKLAGYLDLTQVQRTLINNLLQRDKLSSGDRWTTYIVLARMSEPNAVNYLVQRVGSVEVNDDVIYEVYPDLAYTRQKDVVDLMVQTVMSDDTECSSANNDSDEIILCAYRAMEYLPGVIEDFPWQRDVTGDLDVDDYETALTQIRQWFALNPDYSIDRSGFE